MPSNDSSALRIHLLDVGTEKYGDCLICELGERRILIDGAHAGDYKNRGDRPSIPTQMEELLGHSAPFEFDLLVVTHCHADHIGCLPTLVSQGTIKADWALVADETLGFGRAQDFQPPSPDALTRTDKLAAALREEDYSHLPDNELEQLLEDIATLESRYRDMLAALEHSGTKVVRYGTDDHRRIEVAFGDFGLKVLGPTQEHLKICSQAIAKFNERAPSDVDRMADADLVSIYRSILSQADAAGAEDRPGKGAALNDQSVVLKLTADGATALLAGDMQFAKPEISGIARLMGQLRQSVKTAGPYRFIKLTHHSSYNGFDDSLLRDWSATHHYAHTGGLNDADHPDPGVLQLLEENRTRLQWARTDRNGRVTVSFPAGGPSFEIAFGQLNDATPNSDAGAQAVLSAPGASSKKPVQVPTTVHTFGGGAELSATAKISTDVARVTVTFELSRTGLGPADISRATLFPVPHSKAPKPGEVVPRLRLGSGRKLPKLLFASYRPRLEHNIGTSEAAAALQMIQDSGQPLLEVQTPASPWPEIRSQLVKTGSTGIVILGGYDVLPAQRLDVLPPSLRSQLSSGSDSDNFVVWSDEAYGDKDGDLLPEVPVSRIPDAKSPQLVMAALAASGTVPGRSRYGVRNDARPFAVGPYNLIPGTTGLLVSQPTKSSTIGAQNASSEIVYFMLHGSDTDGTRFWGEDRGGMLEAMNLINVPSILAGVVFAGCCWGALTADQRAATAVAGQPLGIRTSGQSVALSYLHAGVRAFVGCTGTHYSPTIPPYNYFGGPMHTAFFKRLISGLGPAQALFEAKVEYASGMPHGQNSNVGRAIELKIWKQFTCLGLGW